MTEQERQQYRDQMRTAKSEDERNRIRAEHHKRMQERAQDMGMTLPSEPPAYGGGMGPGPGPGTGTGGGRRY
jgi:hypothetical protein